jgi:hypothetical protein
LLHSQHAVRVTRLRFHHSGANREGPVDFAILRAVGFETGFEVVIGTVDD